MAQQDERAMKNGDWGLGIGIRDPVSGMVFPNHQYPITNPQSPVANPPL
jgi:hypothetical protein